MPCDFPQDRSELESWLHLTVVSALPSWVLAQSTWGRLLTRQWRVECICEGMGVLMRRSAWAWAVFSVGFYSFLPFPQASLVAQSLKRLPGMWETRVRSLGWEDSLEKEMATHSSTLAWRIPWREEPGRLQSMGLQRVGHDWATSLSLSSFCWTWVSVYQVRHARN